ncbi:NUDIX domain-containing protein [Mycoplasma elephantis]|uniref:NUDIX domain-containing protein n=1 Tax=Mycoplasma elephantis TaxID=114882 RepID=UPI0005626112|nr:NUDIX hydrolase [Mycoplasma elephantis]
MSIKTNKIFESEWISVYKAEDGFIYAQRKSINSISALLFKKENNKRYFLIHYQPLPEVEEKKKSDDCFPSSVTGALEKNETPDECVVREVGEETGYKITKKNIVASSVSISSTQMNEKVFNFLIDVTGIKQGEIKTDGSYFELVSYNVWKPEQALISILDNELHLSSLGSCYLLAKKI